MKYVTFIACHFLLPSLCCAQVMADHTIDEKVVSAWIVDDIEKYEGLYFFGISEGESQVFLAIEDDVICLQVLDYEWVDDLSGWKSRYTNYHNVRIANNKFYSTETNGEFVIYTKGNEKIYGFKLQPPLHGSGDEYEIGTQGNKDKLEYMYGKYAFTKFDLVSPSQMDKLVLQDLKIMRNEIYARYGHPFAEGGEMDVYFRKQKWYSSSDLNVENLLTEIEKGNIRRIKLAEAPKSSNK